MADKDRYYLIIKRPQAIPDTKRPPVDQEKRAEFIRQVIEQYPEAVILHVHVTEHDIWVDTAQEWLYMQKMWHQVMVSEKAVIAHNKMILRSIRGRFGKKYRKDILECLKEGEAKHELKIVTKPAGSRQDENWQSFDHIYVNQTENGGITGDSFSGTFAMPLPDGTYLETYYSM